MNTLLYPETDNAVKIDRLHQAMVQRLPEVECPVTHRFTPGLYAREIFMPKGTLIVSKIHKTEHPFVVLSGKVAVWMEGQVVNLTAGHVGITKPGTRRVLFIHEDCRWVTFHPTQETDLEKIEDEVILKRDLPQHSQVTADVVAQLKGLLA